MASDIARTERQSTDRIFRVLFGEALFFRRDGLVRIKNVATPV
jgi:hypothetical protein